MVAESFLRQRKVSSNLDESVDVDMASQSLDSLQRLGGDAGGIVLARRIFTHYTSHGTRLTLVCRQGTPQGDPDPTLE